MIPTRNRAQQLAACLQVVARIDTDVPWELVVVDNGSTDETRRVLARAQADLDIGSHFRVVVEPEQSNGRARNRGWRAAAGEIVLYTDDDCYPQDDLIDRVWECFADERIGYVGGAVLLHDPSDDPVTTLTAVDRFELEPYSVFRVGSLSGANMAFRRVVLESIGGFDDAFGHGTRFSCPDPDVFARASFAGWRGAYEPRLIVSHHHRRKPDSPEVNALYRKYAIGRGAFYTKCVLDPRMRWPYLAAWLRATKLNIARREYSSLRFELWGALGYATHRARARHARSAGTINEPLQSDVGEGH